MNRKLISHAASETEAIGHAIGQNLRGGELIILSSDLGGGKITFTRGLTAGFGSKDRVSSPSFTLSREYVSGKKRICHFDFYRLQEAGIMLDEVMELIGDPEIVVVIEWADIIAAELNSEALHIEIVPQDLDSRDITISFPQSSSYLLKF